MTLRDGLTLLADLVDRLEVGDVEVTDASLTRSDGPGFDVDLSVTLPADAEPFATTRTGSEAGDLSAGRPEQSNGDGSDARSVPQPSADFAAQSVQVGAELEPQLRADSTAGSDGGTPSDGASSSSTDERIECRVEGCTETFETEHGMKIHATKAHREADGSAPSPHRNPERLREVYESCETFGEMTEALGVDVTAQTVRRSMMSLGIHDPETEDTANPSSDGASSDERAEVDDGRSEGATDGSTEQAAAADGSGEPTPVEGAPEAEADRQATEAGPDVQAALPEDVDAEVLVTAIREASTLFQVQRALGMQREEAQRLLSELGLLELVTGRVATEEEREVTRAEVERRILECAGDEDAPREGSDPDTAVEAD